MCTSMHFFLLKASDADKINKFTRLFIRAKNMQLKR